MRGPDGDVIQLEKHQSPLYQTQTVRKKSDDEPVLTRAKQSVLDDLQRQQMR